MIWLYIKTWNAYGDHLIQYKKYIPSASSWEKDEGLWDFDENDLVAALCIMAYPKKEDSRIDRLNSRHFLSNILTKGCSKKKSLTKESIVKTSLIPEFSQKVQVLRKMILDRFDNDLPKYYQWSLDIRETVK